MAIPMILATRSCGSSATAPAPVDRALSEDASRWRERVDSMMACLGSSMLDLRRRAAELALADAFEAAGHEGWDGMDTPHVEPSTYLYAHQFLTVLPETVVLPEIYADQDGDICFDWDQGRRYVLTVCVSRDGTLTYAALYGHAKSHGVELLADGLPKTIAALIDCVAVHRDQSG